MNQAMPKLTSSEIAEKVYTDSNFQNILKAYKSDKTKGFAFDFSNSNANGLVEKIVGIEQEGRLISLIVPLFCTSKTITFNFSYFNTIRNLLPAPYNELEDDELLKLIQCPLYYLDEEISQLHFLQLVNLSDWFEQGNKGKNGRSVYFWVDHLPNRSAITLKNLKSSIFVKLLDSYTTKELKTLCLEYATNFHKKFADISQRGETTKIKNIATGLYAQIKTYLALKNAGYAVTMEWDTKKDYIGIDILFTINETTINIDVKSTKDDNLKISKINKETDFYAVVSWEKSEPKLLGFLFKYNFWKSEILGTKNPIQVREDLYSKPLKEIKKDLTTIDKLYNIVQNYNRLKLKRGTHLFNEQ
jgi:hypothetical protein